MSPQLQLAVMRSLNQGSAWTQQPQGLGIMSSYPESSVELHHNISEVNPLPAADELPDLRMVVSANVVAHKVPVDAVPAPLLLV